MNAKDERLIIAEQYLDEMLEAEATSDYDLFVKRFEKKDLANFGASRFKKDMYSIREDLGHYKSREYLGSLKGFSNADNPDKHPGCRRYVWRGVFEKNETIITLGIHEIDGVLYVNEIMYR